MGLLLNLILMLLFILQSIPSMAQTIIALSNNGFRDGDSLVMRKVDGVQPGMSGRDAVWDFSDAVTRRVHTLLYDLEEDTFSAHEDGTSWRTVVNSDTLWLTGFENRHTLMEYEEPLPLLRYPFSYGDSIHGSFHGIGKWCDRKFMRVWGDGIARADAMGTLILPSGDTLRHVLRVHYMRRTWQTDYDTIRTWEDLREVVRHEETRGFVTDASKTTPVIIDTYAWYAPGWRYPVMRIEEASDSMGMSTLAVLYPPESQMELDYDMENALLRQQTAMQDGSGSFGDGQDDSANAMTSHSTNYNAYTGTVTVVFALSRPASVSLLLSDVSGVAWRSTEQSYDVGGRFSLSLSCSGLPHGQYALRITCGTDVITDKFNVK